MQMHMLRTHAFFTFSHEQENTSYLTCKHHAYILICLTPPYKNRTLFQHAEKEATKRTHNTHNTQVNRQTTKNSRTTHNTHVFMFAGRFMLRNQPTTQRSISAVLSDEGRAQQHRTYYMFLSVWMELLVRRSGHAPRQQLANQYRCVGLVDAV